MRGKFGLAVFLLWVAQTGVGGVQAQQTATKTDGASDVSARMAAHGTADALPSVKELLAKSDAALGGRDAWMRSTSRRMKGLVQSEDSSAFVSIEILQKSPNKSLTKVTLPNGLAIREVCDGRAVWIEDVRGGYHELTGPALAVRVKQADLLANMRAFDSAASGKVTGIEKVGAHTVYVVEFSEKKNLVSRLYFDADSGLVVHTEDVFTTPEGLYTLKIDLDDYRDVDGLMFPFRIKRVEKGAVTNLKLTLVNVNPEIDDSVFLKPESAAK
jgi:outer membrane lipoprotein-sorting protein